MKLSRSLLIISTLSFLGAVAAASGACSSSSPTLLPLPPGAKAFDWPAIYVDSTCSGNDYIEVTDFDGCDCGSLTSYALCDGTTYSQCACSLPPDWTPVSAPAPDAGPVGDSGGPIPDAANTDGGCGAGCQDGAAIDAATDAGSPDGATSDAAADGGPAPDASAVDAGPPSDGAVQG